MSERRASEPLQLSGLNGLGLGFQPLVNGQTDCHPDNITECTGLCRANAFQDSLADVFFFVWRERQTIFSSFKLESSLEQRPIANLYMLSLKTNAHV